MSENVTETPNVTEVPNQVFNLVSETYSVLLNTWIWGNQRALEFNKMVLAHLETSQYEGRKYVEDLGSKTRQSIRIAQEAYQDGVKNYSATLNNLRSASQTSMTEVNRKLEEVQNRLGASAN
jgi:polyhydroxyalkanoate synthesis regulator phasin